MAAQALRRIAPWLAFAGPALIVVAIAAGALFIVTAQEAFAVLGGVAAVAAAVCALAVAARVAMADFAGSWRLRLIAVVAAVALVVGGIWGVWLATLGLVIFFGWSIAVGLRLMGASRP